MTYVKNKKVLLQTEIGFKNFPRHHNVKHFDQVFDQGQRDYSGETHNNK